MSDDPVRTWVRTGSGWHSFQEFMIRERARGAVLDLEFRGAPRSAASEQALAAIASARAVVIGPSNPLVSIGPILAVPGMRDALAATRAPVVAVSPIVGGEVLKGPTATFMAFAGLECSAQGVADFYGELLDGIVADENVGRLASFQTDTLMADADSRENLRENHAKEYAQVQQDSAIQEALRRYRPLEQELTKLRQRMGGETRTKVASQSKQRPFRLV